MAYDAQWDFGNFKPHDDFHEKFQKDEAFRNLMSCLASKGVCKLILPIGLGLVGFGIRRVAGDACLLLDLLGKPSMLGKAGGKAWLTLQAMCEAYVVVAGVSTGANFVPRADAAQEESDVVSKDWRGYETDTIVCDVNGECVRIKMRA